MQQLAALLLVFILLTVGCKSEPPEEEKAPNVEPQTEQNEGNRSGKEESSVPPRWANEEELLAEAPKVELVTREIEWLNDEVFLVEVPQDATIKVGFGAEIRLPSGAEAELKVGTQNLVEFERDMRRTSDAEEIPFSGKHIILWKSSWDDERPFRAIAQTNDSVRDYVVRIRNAETLSDCILLLKCLKSYRPKTPYPEEDFKLLSRLDVTYTPKSDDPNKITELIFDFKNDVCARQLLLVTRFPNLESLIIDEIKFGPRVRSLEPLLNLSKLQSLRIQDGSLGPEHMKSLSMIPTLQHLDIRVVESESWFASLGRMAGLKTLSLRLVSNPIEIVGLRHLAKCKDLEDLTLGTYVLDKNITAFEEALEVLSRLPKLRQLRLDLITGPISERISSLKSLESLEIEHFEQATVETFRTLAKTPKLKSLTLEVMYGNKKAQITPEAIQQLGMAPLFETLEIVNLPLGEDELAAISRLPNLAELTLDANNLTPVSLMKFKDAPKLRKLNIFGSNSKITRNVLNEFKQAAPQIMLNR